MNKWIVGSLVSAAAVVGICVAVVIYSRKDDDSIKLAISPYQDLAMIVAKEQVQDEKSAARIRLVTVPWEEILPAIASAGPTVDVGFGSLVEYLTKYPQLNKGQSDPIVFCYPAYVFKGGVFITYDPKVPDLTKEKVGDVESIKKFLSYRIGAQKNSIYEMMLFSLAKKAGINLKDVKITDTSLNDGILATEGGGLDIASAGLTQRAEALRKGGRVVLSMEALGFADITGFICRKSLLEKRNADVRLVIETWFKCVDYVYSDMEKNSVAPLAYLRKNAATKYTFEEYKTALAEEYFPRTIQEAEAQLLASDGKFSLPRISREVSAYLVRVGIAKEEVPVPETLMFAK